MPFVAPWRPRQVSGVCHGLDCQIGSQRLNGAGGAQLADCDAVPVAEAWPGQPVQDAGRLALRTEEVPHQRRRDHLRCAPGSVVALQREAKAKGSS